VEGVTVDGHIAARYLAAQRKRRAALRLIEPSRRKLRARWVAVDDAIVDIGQMVFVRGYNINTKKREELAEAGRRNIQVRWGRKRHARAPAA
jgi:hypothetical protein